MEIHKNGLGQQTMSAGPEASFGSAKVCSSTCYSKCAFSLLKLLLSVFKVIPHCLPYHIITYSNLKNPSLTCFIPSDFGLVNKSQDLRELQWIFLVIGSNSLHRVAALLRCACNLCWDC